MNYCADAIDFTAFRKWLKFKGFLLVHDGYKGELVKCYSPSGIEVLITLDKKKNTIILNAAAQSALEAFISNDENWNIGLLEFGPNMPRESILKLIAARDGSFNCAYCGRELSLAEATIEHIVPRSRGGRNNLYNMAIACKECNVKCSNMSVVEKVKKIIDAKLSKPEIEKNNFELERSILWCLIFGVIFGSGVLFFMQ